MEKATISKLKNRLSAYLQKVRAGETVLILDRDRPIARIERVTGLTASGGLAKLESAGLIRSGSAPLPAELLEGPLPRPKASVLEALLDERAEGR